MNLRFLAVLPAGEPRVFAIQINKKKIGTRSNLSVSKMKSTHYRLFTTEVLQRIKLEDF
jgi:hypothetical protein